MTPVGAGDRGPSLADLKAVAVHAQQRVALYRRRVLLGRGDLRHLDELQRVAAGAAGRLRRARAASENPEVRRPE